MSGFLSLFDKTERIDVAPGYWVEIKHHLTGEEDDRVTRAIARRTVQRQKGDKDAEGELTTDMDMTVLPMELLMVGIVGWNLTDRDDQPLPLEPDSKKRRSISILPDEPRNLVLRRLLQIRRERREQRADKDAQATFRGQDGLGDPAGELNGSAAGAGAVPD